MVLKAKVFFENNKGWTDKMDNTSLPTELTREKSSIGVSFPSNSEPPKELCGWFQATSFSNPRVCCYRSKKTPIVSRAKRKPSSTGMPWLEGKGELLSILFLLWEMVGLDPWNANRIHLYSSNELKIPSLSTQTCS